MTSKNAYRLINPHVEGSLNTIVRAKNSFRAGTKIYEAMSKYFTNHVENFHFTIQNLETKDLTHFRVNEKKGKDNTVDFNLVRHEGNLSSDIEKKLIASVDKMDKQSGGKKKKSSNKTDDSDSSDSESSDESEYAIKIPILPINRFVYYYLPYYKLKLVGMNPLETAKLFMPMFSLPINPTLEIKLDFYP
jgi:hypothetical protein